MSTKFYGLTGGIGAGKSTVAKIFADLGLPILDLDKTGHKLLEENEDLQQQLVQAFGHNILANGSIDRKQLGYNTFQSKANTQKLNQIMHPAIRDAEMAWRQKQTASLAIIEASVLIESAGVQRMDGLIVVLADKEIRKQRVLKRPNFNAQTFDAITKQQTDDEVRKELADVIIANNQGLDMLKQQVLTIYKQLSSHCLL